MKIAVVNLGGNQGKTTLAVNLFAPRMEDVKILAVETINATGDDLGAEVVKLKGEQFSRIYAELAAADELICDVGASNIEDFLSGLAKFEDGHDEIDLFVIPCTSAKKERLEAMKTAAMLSELGVPASNIKFVFNRVEGDVKTDFPDVLDFAAKTGMATANPDCYVPESELFDLLASRKMNVAQGLEDKTDFKAQLKAANAADDKKAFKRAMDGQAIQKLSKSMNRHLDSVFAIITETETV